MSARAPTDYPTVANELRVALNAMGALGVRWENTRFDRYRRALDDAAAWVFPRPVEEKAMRDLLHESLSQMRQLVGISKIWDAFPKPLLASKLKKVVMGPDLPPTESHKVDDARNTLLELSVARYLKHCTFGVDLTEEKEDVVATALGHHFAVECKRPASVHSLEDNLRKLKTQLRRRKANGSTAHGFIALGIDRISDISGSNARVESVEALSALLERGARQGTEEVQRLALKLRLHEFAALGALVFTAPVWISDQSQPWTVEDVAVFRLGATHRDKAVQDALLPLFSADFEAQPDNFLVPAPQR